MRIRVDGEAQPDIQVTGGQPSRVIEAAVGSVFSVNGQTGAVRIDGLTDWVNAGIAPYAADKTGIADSTAAIQAAINACPPGGVVYLPRGTYKTTATLDLKPGVTLRGSHAAMMVGPGMSPAAYPCYIQPAASFTGTSVIQIIGDSDGTHPDISAEQRIGDVTIDGSLLGGSSVDGLYARGNVQNVVLDGFTVRQMPNNGIVTASRTSDGRYPFSWRLRHVMIDGCHANGILLTGCTDVTLDDVQVIGCWGQGIVLANCPNGRIIDSRAEWNGSHGIHITGAWGDWQGSGGMHIADTSTDRNGQHGVLVDATGNTPILITGLSTRRDGRNGGAGGAGYAGLAVIGATVPVTIEGVTCYPGIDDEGTSTNSPQYGARLSGASSVTLDGAHLHGATAGLYDDGTNTLVSYGPNIVTAAGATTSTARTLRPPLLDWINVKQRGAKGDGTTDDTAAIQAALNACPAGGVAYLPAGVYRTSAPLLVPPYVTLRGTHGGGEAQSTSSPTPACIKPLATFTGAAVIQVLDQQLGGYSTISSEVKIEAVTVNGSALTSGTGIAGIQMKGQIQHLTLRDVQVRQVPGNAFDTAYNLTAPAGPQAPFCLHFERLSALWAGGTGFALNNSTDSVFTDCYALGCSSWGWYVAGCNGATWLGCRAEWCGIDGFLLATNTAVQTFIGCSTDRNAQHGFNIPSSTSTGTIVLSGCRMTRDGRNSTTAGYAGLNINTTTRKIVADSLVITTGRDDDGTSGLLTPQYGVSATSSSYVVVASGDVNGVSSAWRDGGGNTTFLHGPMVTGSNITSWQWPGTAATVAAAAASIVLQAMVTGDTQQRMTVGGDGKLNWGSGSVAPDTNLYRGGAGTLKTDSFFVMPSGQAGGAFSVFTGAAKALIAGTAGGGVAIAEGANARSGTATLNGTTAVTIANTSVTANTRIQLTIQAPGGTVGSPYVFTRTAGTSFQIKSTVVGDTSTVAWFLVEPA